MKSDLALPVLLPDQVMMEILSRLPVKPLIRFNCVCKSWKSLISDPIFVKLHLHMSPNNANLIIILNRKTFIISPLIPPLPLPQHVLFCSKDSFFDNPLIATQQAPPFEDYIIGSCNGLVCCLNGSFSRRDFRVRFLNPERRLESGYSPRLPFDNIFVYPIFGFGYDKSSDTYKMVAVLRFHNGFHRGPMGNLSLTESSKPTRVKAYTMGEHCWRDIQTFPAFPIIYPTFENEGSFFKGTLNWLASRNLSYRCYKDLLIVSLDLENETYKQFLLPSVYGDGILDSYGDEIGEVYVDEIGDGYGDEIGFGYGNEIGFVYDDEIGFGYGDEIGIGYGDEIGDSLPYIAILGDCLHLFLDVKKTHLVVWQMKEFGVEESWTQVFNLSYQDIRFRIGKHIQIQLGEHVNFFSLVPLYTTENGIVLKFVNRKSVIFLYNWRDDTLAVVNCDNKLRMDAVKDHVQSLIMPC